MRAEGEREGKGKKKKESFIPSFFTTSPPQADTKVLLRE
jgi:hypothetical protein